ncbi:hypothetical protein GCM10009747_29250 [Agromyces humatus]|uniref:DUF3263 domain-containing protein n=1 Tax=Agromyces humatus TaxID=279573 RepID=A0ABP4X303_9MICO
MASGCSSTGSGRAASARSEPTSSNGARPSLRHPNCGNGTVTTPEKFDEFADRYRAELADAERSAAFADLQKWATEGPLTLLTASKRADISEATVLERLLGDLADPAR